MCIYFSGCLIDVISDYDQLEDRAMSASLTIVHPHQAECLVLGRCPIAIVELINIQ